MPIFVYTGGRTPDTDGFLSGYLKMDSSCLEDMQLAMRIFEKRGKSFAVSNTATRICSRRDDGDTEAI